LLQIRAFIEERLGDPGLTTSTVAAAHHVSKRYVQALFREDNTTVAGWIRARRLERCHRNLGDPRLDSRPVQAIAANWGFADPAHFSRVFRDAYGMPPAAFRQMLREQPGRPDGERVVR
jgi:AraC-like DNA-binding protein